ncbi:MAG: CAP domain-containing protein [Bdellovibrio bacteriovorus]
MKTLAIALAISFAALTSSVAFTEPLDGRSFEPKHSTASNNSLVSDLLKTDPSETTLTQAEQELYRRLMDYRKERGLPMIPISKSLSYVAKLHVRDLEKNAAPNSRNLHSWSENGPWRSVNYTPDHRHAKLMWGKPRELTKYRGNGYEIIHMNSEVATFQGAFRSWQSSALHNAVILNQADWKRLKWRAIGIGIFGRYAAVWFGEQEDPDTQLPGGPVARIARR